MIILDTCVLIAFSDSANPFHLDAQRILAATEQLAITAISGAELMVHPPPELVPRWQAMLRAFAVEVIPITADDLESIARVRRESHLKMPDATVLWAAQTRAAAVASFDRRLLDQAKRWGLRAMS